MLWLPAEDTSAVVLAPAPDILADGNEDLPASGTIVDKIALDGRHGLYDLGNSQSVQFVRLGAGEDQATLAAMVPLGLAGFDRLESVARLLSALHGRAVPRDTRLTRQQRARARRMLQAFDGARDGATQQEIAQVIFRIGPVTRDEWQTSSARHAIKSLLRDARRMVDGGYRALLRHRRHR